MKYFLYTTEWELLHVPSPGPEPENAINKETQVSIPINAPQYSKRSTWTPAWVSTGTAKLVCICADGVTAALLNADFDAQQKLWYGRVVKVSHDKDIAFLACEDIGARLLRKAIPQEDNVLTIDGDAAFKIKSFPTLRDEIELLDAAGNAVTFDADEHNNRGVRITAATTLNNVENDIAANDHITPSMALDSYSEDYTKLHDDDLETWAIEGYEEVAHAAPPVVCWDLDFKFPVARMPVGGVTFHFTAAFRSATDWYPIATAGAVSEPALYIYNYTTSAWIKLWHFLDECEWSTGLFVLMDLRGRNIAFNPENILDFYDVTNSEMTIRIHVGSTTKGANDRAYILVSEAYLTTDQNQQHDPVEFRIVDTKNDDELELAEDSTVYDTVTNNLNIGDPVVILANDEEWVETTIEALARKVNAINAPTSTKPTFFDLQYKPVGQNFDDIRTRNAWYWYLTRSTTSGKPDLNFVEKGTPTNKKLVVYPWHLGKDADIVEDDDAFNAVCQVIVKNATSVGKYPADPVAASDLPELVLPRNDIPDSMLVEVATAVYDQRACEPALSLKVKQVLECVEDFAGVADGTNLDDSALWAPYTDDDSDGATIYAKYLNNSAHFHVDDSLSDSASKLFTFPVAAGATGVQSILFDIDIGEFDAGSACEFDVVADSAANVAVYLHISGTAGAETLTIFDGSGYKTTTGAVLTHRAVFKIDLDMDNQTFALYQMLGGKWTAIAVESSFDDFVQACSDITYLLARLTNGEADVYIHNIACSWDGWDQEVQAVDDDTLFAGVGLKVHAMPANLGETDFQLDEYQVVRELKWTHDECAELKLGFDEATTESVDETIDKILVRHANG